MKEKTVTKRNSWLYLFLAILGVLTTPTIQVANAQSNQAAAHQTCIPTNTPVKKVAVTTTAPALQPSATPGTSVSTQSAPMSSDMVEVDSPITSVVTPVTSTARYLGGFDGSKCIGLDDYCKAQTYNGVPDVGAVLVDPGYAYYWYCRTASGMLVPIIMVDACRWAYPGLNSNYYLATFANYYDTSGGLWGCWASARFIRLALFVPFCQQQGYVGAVNVVNDGQGPVVHSDYGFRCYVLLANGQKEVVPLPDGTTAQDFNQAACAYLLANNAAIAYPVNFNNYRQGVRCEA